jgi:hypothetical protein
VNPANAVTTNPSGCPAVEERSLVIGAPGEVLGVGGRTSRTNLQAQVGGTDFATTGGGHFEATVSGQSQGVVSGGFAAVAPAPGSNPPVMLVTEGSYKAR